MYQIVFKFQLFFVFENTIFFVPGNCELFLLNINKCCRLQKLKTKQQKYDKLLLILLFFCYLINVSKKKQNKQPKSIKPSLILNPILYKVAMETPAQRCQNLVQAQLQNFFSKRNFNILNMFLYSMYIQNFVHRHIDKMYCMYIQIQFTYRLIIQDITTFFEFLDVFDYVSVGPRIKSLRRFSSYQNSRSFPYSHQPQRSTQDHLQDLFITLTPWEIRVHCEQICEHP